MAGKFRGDVGKIAKPKGNKGSRKSKGKRVVSMVKRSSKLPEDALKSRIAQLTGAEVAPMKLAASSTQQAHKPVGKAAIEIVGDRKERIVPQADVAPQRTTAEAIGLRILHQAVRDQSHNRLLPHQNRHDYEYRLRSIATLGAVQLFNSLAKARKASSAVDEEETHNTADKINEKKQVVSKEAFLAALRQPQRMQTY